MTNPSAHLFWITSRAAGTTALILASVSVGFGLLMRSGLIKGSGPDRRGIHETLSLSVMLALALHALALLGDKYLHPSLLDVAVPFVGTYKTLATSVGIVAGWGLLILGLSYYVRGRIGMRRWRSIHRFTLLAWLGGLVHTFSMGTDAARPWFIALTGLTALPAVVLLTARLAGCARQRSVALGAER